MNNDECKAVPRLDLSSPRPLGWGSGNDICYTHPSFVLTDWRCMRHVCFCSPSSRSDLGYVGNRRCGSSCAGSAATKCELADLDCSRIQLQASDIIDKMRTAWRKSCHIHR